MITSYRINKKLINTNFNKEIEILKNKLETQNKIYNKQIANNTKIRDKINKKIRTYANLVSQHKYYIIQCTVCKNKYKSSTQRPIGIRNQGWYCIKCGNENWELLKNPEDEQPIHKIITLKDINICQNS